MTGSGQHVKMEFPIQQLYENTAWSLPAAKTAGDSMSNSGITSVKAAAMRGCGQGGSTTGAVLMTPELLMLSPAVFAAGRDYAVFS